MNDAQDRDMNDVQDRDQVGEKIGNKLIGCEVVLDPTQSGMLYDPCNDFTFSFFKGTSSQDRMKIKSSTDLTCIMKNIKVGILRVYKDNKDLSIQFGGCAPRGPLRPLVGKGILKLDDVSGVTTKNAKIIDRNEIKEIQKLVNNLNSYDELGMLLDVEKQGNNPTSHARASVLDIISERMKHVSGISLNDKGEEAEDITVK